MFFSYGVFFCRKDENFMIWGGEFRFVYCLELVECCMQIYFNVNGLLVYL